MPLSSNFNAFLGAAVLGVISAAGMYLVEHYRQEQRRHAMAKDLARLDQELSVVKRELHDLMARKKEKAVRARKSKPNKANSIISSSTNDEYLSASNIDSSDLEFYDVSDDDALDGSFSLDTVLSEIDRKLDEGTTSDIQSCLERLQDLCLEHPGNSELLWRIGKAHNKLAEHSDDKDFIQSSIQMGVDACTKSLELNPNSADAHKWMAILIGGRSEFQSTKGKITDGHLFKKHLDAALAIKPDDPSLHHMLGRFAYEVASLKWYERKIAATLFSDPPSATHEMALEHFVQCERLGKFEWKENKLMIAKCKIATGDYKEAVEWLQKAKNCKHGDCLDDKVDAEIHTLLDKYNSYR